MKRIPAVTLVKSLLPNPRTAVVFNDKIVDGRSIKVWGWNLENYQLAVELLEQNGYTAEIKTYKSQTGRGTPRTVHRLRVLEK